ncbi:MAG: bifunctional nuclease family protein [Vampirovibrionales bacterium]|nr:bifunctional nuclease family protein [Vampirovibrionales bacterium]
MIELYVMGIALDSRTGTPIVVLNDKDNRRALPIWIGTAEASAIIRQLENIKTTRPMTHDLILNILESLHQTVHRVEINELASDTYFASVFLHDTNGQETMIDARPSDAIAMALKSSAPIYAASTVIAEGAISTDQARDEEEAEEFRKFLQDLKPSDFKNFKIDADFESDQ